MKKLKIAFLSFYILLIIVFIYESALPGKISAKQNKFFKNIFNNISKIFIKNKIIKPTDIVINTDSTKNYYIDDYIALDTKVIPENASYQSLTYSSSNENIATIDELGNITFLDKGSVVITVKQADQNLEKTITFNVIEKKDDTILPTQIDIVSIDDTYAFEAGDYKEFTIKYSPVDITDKDFLFISSDEEVAKFYGCRLFAIKEGVINVTAKHKTTGLSATKEVTITPGVIVEPTTYQISGPTALYINSKDVKYSFSINDEASNIYKQCFFKAYDKFTKKVSDKLVLDVVTGEVLEINKAGDVLVYCYDFELNYNSMIEVHIRNIMPEYTFSEKRLIIGDNYKVNINVINSDTATYFNYEYYSEDPSIASIDKSGNITLYKEGKTYINVVVDDGFDRYESGFNLTVSSRVIEDNVNFDFGKFIRKGLAHFMGFIVFGFVAFFMFIMFIDNNYYKKFNKAFIVILVNGLVFAILTEVIQLFSPGRDGTIKDVLLDYIGYLIAFVISISIYLLYKLIKNKKKKDEDNILEEENK